MVKIAYHPAYVLPLPVGHRFPMEKYELIPGQLLHEGSIEPEQLFEPRICPREILELTHTKDYIDAVEAGTISPSAMRRIGFRWTPEMVIREKIIMQGTVDCALHALKHGFALNIAGGTHHAFASHGEGFCIFNDFGVAANYLLQENLASKIVILDLDVHQGNGTAALFEGAENVLTISLHGGDNYPFHKEKSFWDIPLKSGTSGTEYLGILEKVLDRIKDELCPDMLFYNCGVDVLATDRFGKMQLSLDDCRQRDRLVLRFCHEQNIPCTLAMGGGYSADSRLVVEAHCNTFREVMRI